MRPPPNPQQANVLGATVLALVALAGFSALDAALGAFVGVPAFVHFAVGTLHGLVLAVLLSGLVRAINKYR